MQDLNLFLLNLEDRIEVLFDGTNIDDLGDYRPGLQAAYEIGVISPLKDAGLKKSDIRELSKKSGIEGWDRASFTCLATRFLTGEKIDIEKVKMVEVCENFLVNEVCIVTGKQIGRAHV